MLLTLTWDEHTPGDIPTILSITWRLSTELQVDSVACTCYVDWCWVPAVILEQDCPVAIPDSQVKAVREENLRSCEL